MISIEFVDCVKAKNADQLAYLVLGLTNGCLSTA
jgi:hypothetical protein